MAGTLHTTPYRKMLDLLIAHRHAAGLSQAKLAHRLGKPPSYIAKTELGERRLDLIETLRIYDALGRSLADDLDQLQALSVVI